MTKNREPIFGTDGIRAIAGEPPLTVSDLKRIGSAAGAILLKVGSPRSHARKILIGKDTRGSGLWIEKALAFGLNESGCQVYLCGIIPTSAVAALLQEGDFLGGAVISASHNPPEFNGVKFFSADGKKIPESWEREIETMRSATPRSATSEKPKIVLYKKAQVHYADFLKKSFPPHFSLKGLRWVLDCANGAASAVAPRLFKIFGAKLHVIHAKPDGKNINVNCGALHPKTLQETVVKLKADGGCAFDGDADRVQFVDEKGRLLDGDILLWIAAERLKEKRKLQKDCVVTTVMANFGFFKIMKNLGIQVLTTPVGDRAVSDRLQSSGCVLGGEQSGHIIFKEFLSTGDGILTSLKILEMMKDKGRKLSYYKDHFPKSPQILLNIKVQEKVPLEHLPSFSQAVELSQKSLGDQGRVFVRYSGTEPILRIMVEGESDSQIKKIGEDLQKEALKVLC